MYQDENNLYHYTYRRDGSESAAPGVDEQLHRYQAGQSASATAAPPQPPVTDLKPSKRPRSAAVKFLALALSCALVGGAAGAGITAAVDRRGGAEATVAVSDRTVSQVTLKTVDGKTELSDAENYAANVNSAVSINCSATSTNYFGQPVQSASSGSGFILTTDGYIVTNHHVIDGASSVTVTLYDGDAYDAAVIGSDSDYDIAVLKIDAKNLQAVTLGTSASLNVGDRVLAIGNPLGELTFSMTGGMVSCVNRAINVDGTPFNMIQTDTSINPGNSGGPLLNSCGEVIGIVSAKYSSYSSQSVEGLGFAIPISDVLAMIQDIMTNGYVSNKAYLGITPGTMTAEMARQYRYDVTEGVFVYSVEEGSAADKAGLKMGDVITKVGDTSVASVEELQVAKKGYSAGDTATLTVYRGGQTQTVDVTWGSQPQQAEADASTGATQDQGGQGGSGDQQMQDLFDYFFGSQFGR